MLAAWTAKRKAGGAMNIGYASKTLGFPEGRMRSLVMRNASDERLVEAIHGNLSALEAVIAYCGANGIRLFRIGSDVIPFGSSPANRLDWARLFGERLAAIGALAVENKVRLSMHPGQYTVLNSPHDDVVRRAVDDLTYHAAFLDALGTGPEAKVVLHVGGAYGDKRAALARFVARCGELDANVLRRLVVENDDRLFTAEDALAASEACGIPMVFDVLHHRLNRSPDGPSELELIDAAARTWSTQDGPQKVHYAQQAPGRKLGSHTDTIDLDAFLAFAASLEGRAPDVMLEVKDKNVSALKCLNALDPAGRTAALEHAWAAYKYSVLERDQKAYQQVRNLLKDKDAYPVREFYRLVDGALARQPTTGSGRNAAQHVWGYVSRHATTREHASFERLMERYEDGKADLAAVKRRLAALAERYDQKYLLHSYYFDL